MAMSTCKSTGDWFGSSVERRHMSESIIKIGISCTVQICGVESGGADRVDWSSAEIEQSKAVNV